MKRHSHKKVMKGRGRRRRTINKRKQNGLIHFLNKKLYNRKKRLLF